MKQTKRSKLLSMYYNLRKEWMTAVRTIANEFKEEWRQWIARLEYRLTNLLMHIERTKYVCTHTNVNQHISLAGLEYRMAKMREMACKLQVFE